MSTTSETVRELPESVVAHGTATMFVDGAWVEPVDGGTIDVVDPATEAVLATVGLGGAADVDAAVEAARAAFDGFAATSKQERLDLLGAVQAAYLERMGDLATTISAEMGAPAGLAGAAQAPSGLAHIMSAVAALEGLELVEQRGTTRIVRDPVGVCGLITPWNWPANQIMCKVAPALAAGCTMVLKPSELTPLSAVLIAEILDAAGVPAGVFNLVIGDGPFSGARLSTHPDVDMVSFTGSTRAGVQIAKAAADDVKRVTQELGGKSANIILPDADLESAVAGGTRACFTNSGQSCNAGTRMLVPADRMDEAAAVAAATAEATTVGDPATPGTMLGPVVSRAQWEKIQGLIQAGIDEGARLVAGGLGRPDGIDHGWFVRPTVFADVTNDMTIAREEIFGPVLSIIGYADEDDAVAIANDSEYGLSGYVSSGDPEHAAAVGARLRTGQVHLNGAMPDFSAPFGGYKRSGNGREWGPEGLAEFLEVKALMGAPAS